MLKPSAQSLGLKPIENILAILKRNFELPLKGKIEHWERVANLLYGLTKEDYQKLLIQCLNIIYMLQKSKNIRQVIDWIYFLENF